MPATRQPATALSHALQVLRADEHQMDDLIRQAAWVARCVGRGLTSPLPPEELAELAGTLQRRILPRGTTLFRAGQPSTGVWLVQDGRIELLLAARRRRAVVGALRPGDVDGDIPLLMEAPHPYTARTVGDATCLFLGRGDFEALLADRPALARRWMASVARRLATGQARVLGLLGQPLARQAAQVLLDEAAGGVVRMPQRTLAAMVGVQRPSLNKILKEFEHDGLIRVRYAAIELVDVAGLAGRAA